MAAGRVGLRAAPAGRRVDLHVRRSPGYDSAILHGSTSRALTIAVNRHRGGTEEMVGLTNVRHRMTASEHGKDRKRREAN